MAHRASSGSTRVRPRAACPIALYIGGSLNIPGLGQRRLLRWDGEIFTDPPGDPGPNVEAIATFRRATSLEISLGGNFHTVGLHPSYNFAQGTCWSRLCYANCDGSTTEPILTVDDFTCFINEFAAAQSLPPAQQIEHYANCDGSTTEPCADRG